MLCPLTALPYAFYGVVHQCVCVFKASVSGYLNLFHFFCLRHSFLCDFIKMHNCKIVFFFLNMVDLLFVLLNTSCFRPPPFPASPVFYNTSIDFHHLIAWQHVCLRPGSAAHSDLVDTSLNSLQHFSFHFSSSILPLARPLASSPFVCLLSSTDNYPTLTCHGLSWCQFTIFYRTQRAFPAERAPSSSCGHIPPLLHDIPYFPPHLHLVWKIHNILHTAHIFYYHIC